MGIGGKALSMQLVFPVRTVPLPHEKIPFPAAVTPPRSLAV